MSFSPPPRYHLPTHLDTPDTIELPLFGVTVSVTMRQGVLYLFGGSLAFHLWEWSLALTGLLSMLHWAVPVLLAFLTYVLAIQKVRGRYLEQWALVLYHYQTLPTVFVWCPEYSLMPVESENADETYEQEQEDA